MKERDEKNCHDKATATLKILLAVVFIAGAAARIYGLAWGLPSELHIDEGHLVPRAIKFGTGDLNPHFFLYPSLHMYTLFASYIAYFVIGMATGVFHSASDFAIQYFLDPSPFYVIGRGLSVAMNLGTALLVYAAAKRIHSAAAGAAATVLFMFSNACIEHSHFATTDAPMTFYIMVSLYFGLLMMDTGRRKYYVLSGVAAGFAVATKYTAVLVLPVLIAMHFAGAAGRKDKPFIKSAFLSPDIYILGIAFYAAFFVGCPYHLLDSKNFFDAVGKISETTDSYWLGNEKMTSAWGRIIFEFLPAAMGWPALLLGAGGMAYAALTKNRGGMMMTVFIVFFYLYVGRSRHNFERYWIPVAMALCVLAGPMIAEFARKLTKSEKAMQHVAFAIAAAAVLLNAPSVISTTKYFGVPFIQNVSREWIEKNIPGGSRVAVETQGPQLTANIESQLAAETREFDPRYVNDEAEAFNKIGTKSTDTKSAPSTGDKKYVRMALEKKKIQYSILSLFTLGSLTMDYYRDNGYEYLISSGGMRNRYLAAPETYPKTVAFYRQLDREAKLIKIFKPKAGIVEGEEIRIYMLPASN